MDRPSLGRRRFLGTAACAAAAGMVNPVPSADAVPGAAGTSRAPTVDTLSVVPGPPGHAPAGRGSADDPFRLGAGGEYALNRLIRRSMDAGRPLVVQFGDGEYRDVRLQIIREGTDRKTLSLTERVLGGGRRPTGEVSYADTTECNREGQNCRVQGPDFAIGPGGCAPLLLRAEHPGAAIFDGSGLGGPPVVDDVALLISGAVFGTLGAACTGSASPRIRQVGVEGLVFRNYRNGIHVTYGEEIEIAACRLENIGNRSPRHGNTQLIGTFALRVDGDARTVLLRDNVVRNVWNAASDDGSPAGEHDPGLIHSVYQGYAHDVVFLRNRFHGSSGPMVKFGFYASKRGGRLVCAYPSTPRERCTVFIDNHFELAPIVADGRTVPVYRAQQAFIEENSMELVDGKPTAPAGGAVFLRNTFDNALDPTVPVAFLRQEVLGDASVVETPGWFFAGNAIAGVRPDYLVATRKRGTPLAAGSLRPAAPTDPMRVSLASQLAADGDPGRNRSEAKPLPGILRDMPGRRRPGQDEALAAIAETGRMAWRGGLA